MKKSILPLLLLVPCAHAFTQDADAAINGKLALRALHKNFPHKINTPAS